MSDIDLADDLADDIETADIEMIETPAGLLAGWLFSGPPRFFMCSLRDELVSKAMNSDRGALLSLLRVVPDDLPPATRREHRDTEIKRLAAELIAAHPGASTRQIATWLEKAGRRIEAGHTGLGPSFAGFAKVECDELVTAVTRVIKWSVDWPDRRQIQRIMSTI
jgi:hypothetical protein